MSQDKQRVQTYLHCEYVEAIDAIADKFSLSRSRIICDLVGQKLADQEDMSKAVEDALDDDLLRIARKKKKREKLMTIQEDRENKAAFKDRKRGYLRDRLEGDRAYEPDYQARLAEGYKDDAEITFDDPEQIEHHKQWVDEQMEVYRAGYYARKHADSIDAELQPHNRNKSWMDIGDDLYRLRSRQDEVYQWVRQRADSGESDYKDTVVEYICNQWSVGKAAVLLFLEQLVNEPDTNVKTMLRQGGALMADQEALGSGSSLSELAEVAADRAETEQVVEAEAGVAADRGRLPADRDGSEQHDDHDRGEADRTETEETEQVVEAEPVDVQVVETEQHVDADRRPDGEADRTETEQVEASTPTTDGGSHTDTTGDFSAEELAPDDLIETAEELLRDGEEPHMVELELRNVRGPTDSQRKFALQAAQERVDEVGAEQAEGGSVAAVGGEADE